MHWHGHLVSTSRQGSEYSHSRDMGTGAHRDGATATKRQNQTLPALLSCLQVEIVKAEARPLPKHPVRGRGLRATSPTWPPPAGRFWTAARASFLKLLSRDLGRGG